MAPVVAAAAAAAAVGEVGAGPRLLLAHVEVVHRQEEVGTHAVHEVEVRAALHPVGCLLGAEEGLHAEVVRAGWGKGAGFGAREGHGVGVRAFIMHGGKGFAKQETNVGTE